jgi:hypothetical protein
MRMSTNSARETAGIAQRRVARSAVVLNNASSSAERLIKNQKTLYLVRRVAIAAKVVNAANGTMLLRRTITELICRIGSSCEVGLLQLVFLMVMLSDRRVTE